MIIEFLLTIVIVGFVTAGLNIKFDRFFTILLLLFIFKLTVFESINIFLWVIMLGALMIILDNKDQISSLPRSMKIKLFVMIPIFTLIASFFGSCLFSLSGSSVLIIILGILAILYGLRLVFIHFKQHELDLQNEHPVIAKICGLFGPVLSGFTIGLVGTSVKPLKIPFAVKIGRMNAKKVYLGNTVTALFASVFAIMWHFFFTEGMTMNIFYEQMLVGVALWTGIHYMFEFTNIFFKNRWRKSFQVFIGILLVLVSIKIFMLI